MFWNAGKTIYKKDELTKYVHDTIEYYENYNKQLIEQNKKLGEDAISVVRADYEEELQYLHNRLAMSYGEFATEKEKQAYKDFEQRHMHERLTSKSKGGKAPYLIPTGTGIGTYLEVVCPICGEKENITDLEVW